MDTRRADARSGPLVGRAGQQSLPYLYRGRNGVVLRNRQNGRSHQVSQPQPLIHRKTLQRPCQVPSGKGISCAHWLYYLDSERRDFHSRPIRQ